MEKGIIAFDLEALNQFETLVAESGFSKIFFLVDSNTHENCLIPLVENLPSLEDFEILEVDPGEENKSAEVLFHLWSALSELKADRFSLVVNVGGGMITDLGGFLASTYMRGISFVNFPTSVLAQVDASVGGKTGINLDHKKNRIGVFQEPLATFIINDFLDTLPLIERKSGFAEMLKHALIADPSYWNELVNFKIEEQSPSTRLIQRSVEIKSEIVKLDFKENGKRKVLNFGHTVGHALESAALDQGEHLPHGYAVAYGMIAEVLLSAKYEGLSDSEMNDIVAHLLLRYNEFPLHGSPEVWIELMRSDKKNVKGEFRFSLIKKIGEPSYDVAVTDNDILSALQYLVSNE